MTAEEWQARLLAGITEAEILDQIDAGLHDPGPEVLALVSAAIADTNGQPVSIHRLVEMLETPVLPVCPPTAPPAPPRRGRPAHPKSLLPLRATGITGAVLRWAKLEVKLPKARAKAVEVRRAFGATTVKRVKAACAAIGGSPTARLVLDYMDLNDPRGSRLDRTTISRAMAKFRIKPK